MIETRGNSLAALNTMLMLMGNHSAVCFSFFQQPPVAYAWVLPKLAARSHGMSDCIL